MSWIKPSRSSRPGKGGTARTAHGNRLRRGHDRIEQDRRSDTRVRGLAPTAGDGEVGAGQNAGNPRCCRRAVGTFRGVPRAAGARSYPGWLTGAVVPTAAGARPVTRHAVAQPRGRSINRCRSARPQLAVEQGFPTVKRVIRNIFDAVPSKRRRGGRLPALMEPLYDAKA